MINWAVVAHDLRRQSGDCTIRANELRLSKASEEAIWHEISMGAIFIGLALAIQMGLNHPE